MEDSATQCRDHALEEARRELGVFKKAYYKAEREIRDLWEMFEREKHALNDEIRRLRERDIHGRAEGSRCHSGFKYPHLH